MTIHIHMHYHQTQRPEPATISTRSQAESLTQTQTQIQTLLDLDLALNLGLDHKLGLSGILSENRRAPNENTHMAEPEPVQNQTRADPTCAPAAEIQPVSVHNLPASSGHPMAGDRCVPDQETRRVSSHAAPACEQM